MFTGTTNTDTFCGLLHNDLMDIMASFIVAETKKTLKTSMNIPGRKMTVFIDRIIQLSKNK